VATSPYRIKSPVPVCCGFSSKKWWAREDLHLQGSQTLDLRGLLFPLNHSPEKYLKLEPPAGAAPARFFYKRNPQAAARRRKWPAKPKLGERRMVAVPSAALGAAGV